MPEKLVHQKGSSKLPKIMLRIIIVSMHLMGLQSEQDTSYISESTIQNKFTRKPWLHIQPTKWIQQWKTLPKHSWQEALTFSDKIETLNKTNHNKLRPLSIHMTQLLDRDQLSIISGFEKIVIELCLVITNRYCSPPSGN